MNDEIKEILDYFQKDVDKYEESKKYLMEKYGYNQCGKLLNETEDQCKKQKEVIDRLNFIKNRKNQGASQENINKMAIEFVNNYVKEVSE